ncbi:MAG: hypothetical protein IT379_42080 [Deltaproteobacteria bacterium]|nr:hypothetical protein [Deltaproteobacteria bacterium]
MAFLGRVRALGPSCVLVAAACWFVSAAEAQEEHDDATALELIRNRFRDEILTQRERSAWMRIRLAGTEDAPPMTVTCGLATAAARVAAELPPLLGIGPTVQARRWVSTNAVLSLVGDLEDAAQDASNQAERADGDLVQRLSNAADALTEASVVVALCDEEAADEEAALDRLVATVEAAMSAGAGRGVLQIVLRVYAETVERARRAPRVRD